MKLKDLIDALAGEIKTLETELEPHLDQLAKLEIDNPAFMDTLDMYCNQVQRLGEASEMAGFAGLQSVSAYILENTLFLAALEPGERADSMTFLRTWPGLMIHYLEDLSDSSRAAGLVDALTNAPQPITEKEGMQVMHQLGALPMQVNPELLGDGAPQRAEHASEEDVALEVPADTSPKLMEGFVQEAPAQAAHLVRLIENLARGEGDSSDLIAAKRIVHTLKGSGAIIGLKGLASLGHHFEDILEHLERNEGNVSDAVTTVLMDAAYCLEHMVSYVEGTDAYPQQSLSVLQQVLDLAHCIDRGAIDDFTVRTVKKAPAPAPIKPAETAAPTGAVAASGLRVDLEQIKRLFRTSSEVSVQTSAMEAKIKQLTEQSKVLSAQNMRMKKRLFELETIVDIRSLSMLQSHESSKEGASFDSLEMDQYNELHSVTHALVEEANDAIIMSRDLEAEITDLRTMQNRQQLLSRELQWLVIGTRMKEVNSLESRLQRNIRNTCQATGKQADLTFTGGGTLIDNDVISRLTEPLLHLIRNAIDHGLETPEERETLGKNPYGSLHLDFSRTGQMVRLVCQDDGGGIDVARVKARAIEHGLITAEQDISDEEAMRLILHSGFSTRDNVSEVSGRGVGLNAVSQWIMEMNGSINIDSTPGKGTTFELLFPASLSTAQSLIVDACGQYFSFTSSQIEQALPKQSGTIVESDGKHMFRLEDVLINALRLNDIVGLTDPDPRPWDELSVVIVNVDKKRYAIGVNNLVDSRELFISPPGRFERHLIGLAGTSIMGEGHVVVHLDLAHLLAQGSGKQAIRANVGDAQAFKARTPTRKQVLVVDDSLSVRNSLSEFMEDLGYHVQTARDGIDAIDVLADFRPTIILTDLEMPNMNGVEFTAHVRSRDEFNGIPIVMITSRSQDKHRNLAMQAGVDAYVTKPYNEGNLMQIISQVTQPTASAT